MRCQRFGVGRAEPLEMRRQATVVRSRHLGIERPRDRFANAIVIRLHPVALVSAGGADEYTVRS